jgi:hypothetical protein
MKRNLKKLGLKKQTLHLLNVDGLNVRLGGENLYGESRYKICPLPSINQCYTETPSCNSRCDTCNGFI